MELFGYGLLCDRHGRETYSEIKEDVIADYKDSLSNYIIEIWQKYGLTSHADTFLRLVNPKDYEDIVKLYKFSPDEYIPYAINSFGKIYCWNEDGYTYQLDPYIGDMYLSAEVDIDEFFAFGFTSQGRDDLPNHNIMKEDLGLLLIDEIYAIYPIEKISSKSLNGKPRRGNTKNSLRELAVHVLNK